MIDYLLSHVRLSLALVTLHVPLPSSPILQASIILPFLQHVHVDIRHLDLLQPPVSHLWAPCAPPQVDEVHLLRLLPNSHAQVQQQSLSCMQQLTP